MLALPILAGMSLQTIYFLADMIFVGRVSAESLAALAFNMPLVFLGIGIIFGLGSGVTAVIAQFIGARDKTRADSSAEHAVLLGLLLSGIFTFIAYGWGKQLLAKLGVPGEMMPLAWDYFRVLAGGYLFVVMSVFFRSILSGEGNVKTPMMIQGGGTLLNIVLDPICIFTLDMGVTGAALATVISQALVCSVFVYLLFFKKHAYVTFDLKDFRFSSSILWSIFRIGAPASFSFVVMAIGGAFFNRILIEFSAEAVAAFQVGARIDHVFMLPVIAMSASLVTLVGMFYGADRRDLVRQVLVYALSRAVAVSLALGSLFFWLAPSLVALFSDERAIKEVGIGYLRIAVFAYPFIAIVMLTGRALQGMGRGLPLLVLSLLRVILISGPLAWFFVYRLDKGVTWVWIAIVVGMMVSAIVALVWLSRELIRSTEGGGVIVSAPAAPPAE